MSPLLKSKPRLTMLEGQQIRLRPFLHQDISDEYIEWLNDPRVVRFSNQRFREHNVASSERYLQSFAGTDNLFVAIISKKDDRMLGTMTAYISRYHGTADVGTLIGNPDSWGKGIGQDAFNVFCNWLIGPDVGIRKLTAGTARSNVGMIRVYERYGMKLECVKLAQEVIEGKLEDLLYFAYFRQNVLK